jgi:hypothetical protein
MDPCDEQHGRGRGLVAARLIRHGSIFQTVAVVALAVAMVLTAFRAALVLAVGVAMLLHARLSPAAGAAVALTAEAAATDAEHRATPAADTPEKRDKGGVHQHSGSEVDCGRRLCDARTVTV